MLQRFCKKKFLVILTALICLGIAQTRTPGPSPFLKAEIHITLADKILACASPAAAAYKLLFEIHHLGDLSGHHIPLQAYSMSSVIKVLEKVDQLLPTTELSALLAASYFSHSPVKEHLRLLAYYLVNYSMIELDKRWPWLLRAMYITCQKLGDPELTLQLAKPLRFLTYEPDFSWVKDIPLQIRHKKCLPH